MTDRIDDILHGMMLAIFSIMSILSFLNARNKRRPVRLNIAMGLLMGLMAMQSFEFIVLSLLSTDQKIVKDSGLSIVINLLIVPFCNYVVMELMRYKRITVRMMLWHAGIPLLMATTYYVQLLGGSAYRNLTLVVYAVWVLCFSGYYIFHIVRVAPAYEKLVEDVYADTDGRKIGWLRKILLLLLGVTILFVVMKVFVSNDISRLLYTPLCLVFWLPLCWNILQMRCADLIEVDENVVEELSMEETACPTKTEDYTKFLASLHQELLRDELYTREDLTREIVAKKMNTNHKYLTRKLKEATTMTFSAYVNEVRLEQSTRMLLETDMTVEEVFYACGYQTKSTYYRAFTKKYGCTPLEYRKAQNYRL